MADSEAVEPSAPQALEKTERLGCLYLTFLNHPGGLSFQEIKEFLPLAYPGDQESSRRKFERDKDELKRLGLALRHYGPGETMPNGRVAAEHRYVPVEEIQKLPELKLSALEASELAAVLFAAIEEHRQDDPALVEELQSAAVKLLYRHPASQGGLSAPEEERLTLLPETEDGRHKHLTEVMDALHRRRLLRILYPSRSGPAASREVEGRGLLTHRGRWCLVAYCRKVKAIRSFYLDRAREVEVLDANYARDPNFNIKDYSLHPLGIRLHAAEEIRLEVDEEREEVFRDFLIGLPPFLEARVEADGYWRIHTTNRGALFSWMIRNPGVVRAIGPEPALASFGEYRTAMDEPYRRLAGGDV